MKKITISGVDCLMSSSVHQSTGDIFFKKDPKEETHDMYGMFTEDEATKVMAYLRKKGWSTRCSDSTHFGGWGRRISLISVYMSSEAIENAFTSYFKKHGSVSCKARD